MHQTVQFVRVFLDLLRIDAEQKRDIVTLEQDLVHSSGEKERGVVLFEVRVHYSVGDQFLEVAVTLHFVGNAGGHDVHRIDRRVQIDLGQLWLKVERLDLGERDQIFGVGPVQNGDVRPVRINDRTDLFHSNQLIILVQILVRIGDVE